MHWYNTRAHGPLTRCPGNAGNVFPATDFKEDRLLAISECITARASPTHVPWSMSGSLIHGGGENVYLYTQLVECVLICPRYTYWSLITHFTTEMNFLTRFNPKINCTLHCVTARFVTRFNLWLRHDLWPHNASICDPARFVTKSASICDQRYTMILESNLCRGKLVFVFTLIMYTKWYNVMIYIYELWYNTYINSGARSLMLFTLILLEYHAWHIYIIYHVCVSYFMHHS